MIEAMQTLPAIFDVYVCIGPQRRPLPHFPIKQPGPSLEDEVLDEVYDRCDDDRAGDDSRQVGCDAVSFVEEEELAAHEEVQHDGLKRDLAKEPQDRVADAQARDDRYDEDDKYDLEERLLGKGRELVEHVVRGSVVFGIVDTHIHKLPVKVVEDHEEYG